MWFVVSSKMAGSYDPTYRGSANPSPPNTRSK